jgi:hypothetical protein
VSSEEVKMRTEREKMVAGELYDPLDLELVAARTRARGPSPWVPWALARPAAGVQ